MKYQHVLILAGAAFFVLSGCGSSSSRSDSPPQQVNSAERIFSADPGGDASAIADAATLGTDIDNIFGGENAEPVSVNPGDTIGDVFDRAKNR